MQALYQLSYSPKVQRFPSREIQEFLSVFDGSERVAPEEARNLCREDFWINPPGILFSENLSDRCSINFPTGSDDA